jgi:hypothetical protein
MAGNQLYELSLDLLGLKSENGQITSDSEDLASRSLSLINVLLAENSSLDCRIKRCEHTVYRIDSLEDEIGFTDIVASTVLPYGLAHLLMLGEDDPLALSMKGLYEKARTEALRFGKAKAEPITEVYR